VISLDPQALFEDKPNDYHCKPAFGIDREQTILTGQTIDQLDSNGMVIVTATGSQDLSFTKSKPPLPPLNPLTLRQHE
jgi:hypothetical protein